MMDITVAKLNSYLSNKRVKIIIFRQCVSIDS